MVAIWCLFLLTDKLKHSRTKLPKQNVTGEFRSVARIFEGGLHGCVICISIQD